MKPEKKNKLGRILLFIVGMILILIVGFVLWFKIDTKIVPPSVADKSMLKKEREVIGDHFYKIDNNWLKKNKYGLWEMYLEGNPFEIGVASGMLTKELIYKQEVAFVDQIRKIVPSESYLKFLKYFVGFFNRDIDEHILPEYQEEIYGISFSASEEFDFIGTNYERMLNYHGAHDIGHALQDLMLVGCTSFAANLHFSDSSLILGRNFDFYINDAFAEDKIVCFVNPENGHQFAYITWASFIGVVSGMNAEGLTVTINAGKSDIPSKAATPISLLAREILQYASNFDEAIAIAKRRKTFVAESLLIGSAKDNTAIIIEKSPDKFGIYEVEDEFLVCSNHFQSSTFENDDKNLEHIFETASFDRQERAQEILDVNDTVTYFEAAEILRDRLGKGSKNIGIGNEKAMAQMISHHSVIFQPVKRNLWVSTQPFQFGEYLGYNMSGVFNKADALRSVVFDTALTIPADPFIESESYLNYLSYKNQREVIITATDNNTPVLDSEIDKFINLNPEYFQAYVLAGDYFSAVGNAEKAHYFYTLALSKEFEKSSQKEEVVEKFNIIKSK